MFKDKMDLHDEQSGLDRTTVNTNQLHRRRRRWCNYYS